MNDDDITKRLFKWVDLIASEEATIRLPKKSTSSRRELQKLLYEAAKEIQTLRQQNKQLDDIIDGLGY
jgi:adenylosuccinate lyase